MARVDGFLGHTRVAPATLGWQAVGDPDLVRELRDGRSPRLSKVYQVLAFMEVFDRAHLDRVSPGALRSGIHPQENGETDQ